MEGRGLIEDVDYVWANLHVVVSDSSLEDGYGACQGGFGVWGCVSQSGGTGGRKMMRRNFSKVLHRQFVSLRNGLSITCSESVVEREVQGG